MVMVFSVTFNNISVILWRSDLLVEQIGVPGENHPPVPNKLWRFARMASVQIYMYHGYCNYFFYV